MDRFKWRQRFNGNDRWKKMLCTILILNLLANNSFAEQIKDRDIKSIKINILSINEKEQCKEWGLSEDEWLLYKKIMNTTPRGIFSPSLDPITALGIEASDDTKRRKYAKLWIKLQMERIEKEFIFEQIKNQVAKEMYPNSKLGVSSSEIRQRNNQE